MEEKGNNKPRRLSHKRIVNPAGPTPIGSKSGGKGNDLPESDREAYLCEFSKLNNVFREADNTWDDRIYQIAAGGLSLCLASFSFLAGIKDDFVLDWKPCAIMAVYAFVILLNFISQRLSTRCVRQLVEDLRNYMNEGKEFVSEEIQELYDKRSSGLVLINWIEGILLIADVACTVWFLWAAL